jgi:nicotinamide phosphoribosyltransferase
MNSAFLTDGYKTGHHLQYPGNITKVLSNLTPRSSKHAPMQCRDYVVVWGVQMALTVIKDHFDKNFFKTELRNSPYGEPKLLNKIKKDVIDEIKEEFSMYLNTDYDTKHFEDLWDLGYLPIEVRSLAEGSICPIGVPMMTIHNTDKRFYWITNYLETVISNLIWKPITSATIADAYKKLLVGWAVKTDSNNVEFVDFQGHDFSMRGMDSIFATQSSGLGHLLSFKGTDSLPSIYGARKYYDAKGFVGGTVPATEHSVMCAGSKEGELETFRRLLKTYPTGVLSIVSDTWDLWNVATEYLPILEEEIMARDGKLVIRPDSGDPADIICGESIESLMKSGKYDLAYDEFYHLPQHKGLVEILWDTFGGTINEDGYKVLDSHIGAIYGDSITLERAQNICARLEKKGFASTNVVFGIGSFTYQFNTRDTFGFAVKATYVEFINDAGEIVGREIFKDPITDDGTKKSAKGLPMVKQDKGAHGMSKPYLYDQATWEEFTSDENMLKVIFRDGEFVKRTTLDEARARLTSNPYG